MELSDGSADGYFSLLSSLSAEQRSHWQQMGDRSFVGRPLYVLSTTLLETSFVAAVVVAFKLLLRPEEEEELFLLQYHIQPSLSTLIFRQFNSRNMTGRVRSFEILSAQFWNKIFCPLEIHIQNRMFPSSPLFGVREIPFQRRGAFFLPSASRRS